MANTQTLHKESIGLKVVIYIVCIILAILSLMPFFIMFMNATRSTAEIQSSAISLYSEHPILNLTRNWKVFNGKSFDPATGFINSLIVSTCTTILAVYFSCLTSYALFAYEWKLRDAFFGLISSAWAIASSKEPYAVMIAVAVFSPIPATPGILSDASPISAFTSTNCSGLMP